MATTKTTTNDNNKANANEDINNNSNVFLCVPFLHIVAHGSSQSKEQNQNTAKTKEHRACAHTHNVQKLQSLVTCDKNAVCSLENVEQRCTESTIIKLPFLEHAEEEEEQVFV